MSPPKFSRGVPKQIDKNALLIAQEITFAKFLSGNDPKIRERGIKKLRKWLTARSSGSCQFNENDLKRIWKGLFYYMWMSDKPLIQEEVAENISNLVHCFNNTKVCICFVKCFLLTMAVEWRGLDHWRMDKFLMFVRRFLRQVFVYCDKRSWPVKLVNELGVVFNATILPDHKALTETIHPPIGFSLHFVDIYMDELTKVSKGHLQNDELLVALLRPFAVYMSEAPEQAVAKEIVSQIFDRLIEQSKEGHKFREKFEAWKQLGFPRGNIDAVERVHTGDSDEEMDEYEMEDDEQKGALDPRAGGVDVELPVANYNPEAVVNLLREYRHSKTSTAWSRKVVARIMARFSAMTLGKYPLGIKKVEKIPKINFKKLAKRSAQELFEFRDRIMYEDDEEWIESLQGNKKRKDKSASIKSTKSDEDDDSEEMDTDEGSDYDEEVDVDSDDDGDIDIDDDDDVDTDDNDDTDIDDDDSDVGGDDDDSDVGGDDDDAELDDSGDDVGVDGSDVGVDGSDVEDDAGDVENDGSDAEDHSGGVEEHDIDNTRNGDIEEELEEDHDENEVEEEPVKLKSKNKKKKNAHVLQEETPQKKTPRNLPKVIPFQNNSKKQKNEEGVKEGAPQKETSKNSPEVIAFGSYSKKKQKNKQVVKGGMTEKETLNNTPEVILNGISKKQKKMLGSKNVKKEEIVIVVGRKRKLAEALTTPVIRRGKHLRSIQDSPRTPQTPGSAKRVQFILQRNTAQATSEYDKILRENPGNPYDSAKKPRFSVLKSTPLASPVNPFYKP